MDDLVETQRVEIEMLRERVRQLLDALAPAEFVPPIEWGLKATEIRIFCHLKTRPLATKESVFAAAYGHWLDEPPAINTIESHISKMRRKLRRHGLDVRGERFVGYRLVTLDGRSAHG